MPEIVHIVPRPVVLAILDAVARKPVLWRDYVLKGSLPLHLLHGSPRPSHDLDFTAIRPFTNEVTAEKNELLLAFSELLKEGLEEAAPAHGFERMTVTFEEFSEEIPNLLARIGYTNGADRAEAEVQVTLSEVVCETVRSEVAGIPVHVPALEDILAEKLKALVQQVPRSVVRSSDVYDLWYCAEVSPRRLDPAKIARYLRMKSALWPEILPLTRSRFHDPAVRRHAAAEYEKVLAELPEEAPAAPMDEAFDAVLRLVDRLGLE